MTENLRHWYAFSRCIISMGLDKKPTPPPKKVEKNGAREEPISSQHSPDVQPDMNGEDAAHHSARETNQKEEVVTATEEGNVRDGIDTILVYHFIFLNMILKVLKSSGDRLRLQKIAATVNPTWLEML